MSEDIVLLAVTRMLTGFCIAGIDATGTWRRPVKRADTLLLGDISYRDKTVMSPFDRVALNLQQPRPDPPHVEDCICDFLRQRPTRTTQLTGAQRAAFLDAHAEPGPGPVLRGERSLLLMKAEDLSASFHLDGHSGRFVSRARIPGIAEEIPCTDLRWRAFGRAALPAEGGSAIFSAKQLAEGLGADAIFVALGLARELNGRHSPLVVGIHIVPDYQIDVDYTRP
jgi:hypothetical protein